MSGDRTQSIDRWRAENPERVRVANRNSAYKRRYNITLEDYNEMLVAQGHCCAICSCGSWESRDGRLHVDHDHQTGEVRGLLCYKCNVGLGSFQDDPAGLRAAADYLERSRG